MDTNIPVGVGVECADGVCGTSTRVIINPVKNRVTHLVVKQKEFPHVERMVPIEWVSQTTSNLVQLKYTKDKLNHQDRFIDTEYVKFEPLDIPPYGPVPFTGGIYLCWPYSVPESDEYIPVEHEHVPPGELAVRRGAQVEATDGHIGRVDAFLVDPKDEQITHLIMREGHIWGKRDVTIPVSQIDHFEQDVVYLKLDKEHVEALPAIPIHRRAA